MTELKTSQLKKYFQSQIFSFSFGLSGQPSTSLLTDEELLELQNAWIQLEIWKQNRQQSTNTDF
ncbi:hypothetical protein [Vibrio sp. MA40-2]|uniref:hypothetical protein n=1 Tax=Vibrio sp. MA40-2 TaxID=3391828 RepID=UPI0039A6BB7E